MSALSPSQPAGPSRREGHGRRAAGVIGLIAVSTLASGVSAAPMAIVKQGASARAKRAPETNEGRQVQGDGAIVRSDPHAFIHDPLEAMAGASEEDVRDPAQQLHSIQKEWYQNHVDTHVGTNSHAAGLKAISSSSHYGKGKPQAWHDLYGPSRYSHGMPNRHRKGGLLRFTSQPSPFHSSEVGALASRQPEAISVGIFRPGYPFLPSGRRRRKEPSTGASPGTAAHNGTSTEGKLEDISTVSPFSDELANTDVFKKGWTTWMLDDDARLAVPDDHRRPRRDSAFMLAKKLFGKKWYRWQPGQGYVLSRYKDYSAYRQGPGIALGHLLPPREHVYTSHAPLIPNDSKRDQVFLIMVWILFFALLAFVREVRLHLIKARKGKRRSLVDNAGVIPSIRVFDEDHGSLTDLDVARASIGLRTRQRSQASRFRDLCRAAFQPTPTNNGKKRNSFSLTASTNFGMPKVRQGGSTSTMSASGGASDGFGEDGMSPKDLLPFSSRSSYRGTILRSRSTQGTSDGASQDEIDERTIFDSIKLSPPSSNEFTHYFHAPAGIVVTGGGNAFSAVPITFTAGHGAAEGAATA